MTQPQREMEMPDTPLDWALTYAAKGWRVLPIWWTDDGRCACNDTNCRAPGKHPIGYMVADGVKSATNSEELIRAWATQAPHMNIAIATGSASSLVVLDLDVREVGDEIVDGEFELQTWLAARGIELPDTMVQSTGGGGSHILLDWPANGVTLRPVIASRANWLPGVDIRADGGYIVAAPSRHISGKLYHWRNGAALSAISNDLLNVLSSDKRQTSSGASLGPATQSMDVQALIADGFRLGGRDDGFTRLAGILRARGDSLDTARIIVKTVWEKTDQTEADYFPLGTAFEKLERGYKRWDAPEPIDDDALSWAMKSAARAEVQKDIAEKNPALGSKPSSSKPTDSISPAFSGAQKSSQEPIINPVFDEDEDEEEERDPSDPLDVAALMSGGEIEREFPTMLQRSDGKHLIYPGRLHSIYGEPGHGKTWVSLALVRERLEKGETVVYLDYDEDDGGKSMALRLLSLGVNPAVVGTHLRYLNPQGLGRQQLSWVKLKRQIKEWKPSLVIVDTMAPALVELGLNEKDNAEVGAWYAHARWLLRGLNPQAALVIIDHVTKSGEGRGRWARGAGDKLGRLHAAYAVESTVPFSRTNPGFIRLVIAKDRGGEVGREGEAAAVIKFTPHNEGTQLDIVIDVPESADISSLAAQHENRKKTMTERMIVALKSTGTAMTYNELKRVIRATGPEGNDVLDEAIDSGLLVPDGGRRVVRYTLDSSKVE